VHFPPAHGAATVSVPPGVGKNPIEENSMIRLRLLEHILPQRRYGGKTTMATDGNGWQF
jgi:hypothetical protein